MKKFLVVLAVIGLAASSAWAQQSEGLDFDYWSICEIDPSDSTGMRAKDIWSGDYFWGRWSMKLPNPPDSARVRFFELDGTTGAPVDSFTLRHGYAIGADDFCRADSIYYWNRNASVEAIFIVVGQKKDQTSWEGGRK